MPNPALDFSSENLPQVALDFMNAVHSEELHLVSTLLAQLEEEGNEPQISQQLAEWIQHTQDHFGRENFLMQEYDFFAYPMHSAEHAQALQQLLAVQEAWNGLADRKALGRYLQTWRQWLQQHIASMDFVTAQFLSRFPLPNEVMQIDELRGDETQRA